MAITLTGGIGDEDDSGWRRLTFYVYVQVVSVLVPGLVLMTEAGVVLHTHGWLPLVGVADQVRGLPSVVSFALASVFLAVAYLLGYLARELGFAALSRVERLRRFRREPLDVIRAKLSVTYGEEVVAAVEHAHPVVRHALEGVAVPMRPRGGGGHVDDTSLAAFAYSKLWLRRKSPSLNVDSIEVEINILAASYCPQLGAAVTILASSGANLVTRMITVLVLALAMSYVTRSLIRLRHAERWEALRNLVSDMSMRKAELLYPTPPAPSAPTS